MSQINPKISLGLPVFNGENYIELTIRSILDQTYTDFELIISDNASLDRTEEICRDYSEKDSRIRYYRNEKNLGLARNFRIVFELSSGKYFKWAAHDDIIAPDYLSKCVNVLEQDSSIVMCYTKTKLINEHGKVLYDYDITLENTASPNPQDRFKDLVLINHWGSEIFGLIRSDTLKMTPLIASYAGSDRPLIAELSLHGRFYEIPEYLFFSRDHTERSVRKETIHSREALFDPANAGKVAFPHWRLLLEYWKSVRRFPLNRYERIYCYLHLGRWLIVNLNWARMLMDLAMAVEPRSWELIWRLKRKSINKG